MEITWVYYGFSWDPEDKSIAGSEQAVVHLSEHWVQKGYKVVVYSLVPTKVVNGVSYNWIECFDTEGSYEILILCREGTLNVLKDRRPKAKLVLSDLQDDTQTYKHMEFVSYVDRFMFKSSYHVSCYKHLSLPESKIFVCPNGLQVNNFKGKNLTREPLRFCYTSAYERGLEQLLEWSWPQIHAELPGSTLHVYYGWQQWFYSDKIDQLLKQPGVVHHGRVSNSEIAEEKYKSSMHLYPCHSATEIDCINVRESALAGCIPVLSTHNVCSERDGVHVAGDPKTMSFHNDYAKTVVALVGDEDEQDSLRKKFSCSSFLFDWNFVSDQWISVFTRSP
jgi:glycosyltransferase involved in cell wall biosynthesis